MNNIDNESTLFYISTLCTINQTQELLYRYPYEVLMEYKTINSNTKNKSASNKPIYFCESIKQHEISMDQITKPRPDTFLSTISNENEIITVE